MNNNVGDNFQTETKYSRNKSLGSKLDWANKPEIYKTYPSNKTIQLPNPLQKATDNFMEVLQKRKSTRSFSTQPLSKLDLAFLLWAFTGIQRTEHGYEFRTTPSAGALYPIETYIATNNVQDLEKGIYHYNIKNHLLEEITMGNFGEKIAHAALNQEMCADAAVVFIWTAVFSRSKWKYQQRAYRYIYLDAGHIAQNLALAGSKHKLWSLPSWGFF